MKYSGIYRQSGFVVYGPDYETYEELIEWYGEMVKLYGPSEDLQREQLEIAKETRNLLVKVVKLLQEAYPPRIKRVPYYPESEK